MATKLVKVSIKGKSPLLMHRYPMEPVKAMDKKPIEEQAEISAYRTPEGVLYIPGQALWRCFVNGATYQKKGRMTLQKIAAACLMVDPEYLSLGVTEYEIDSRSAVNPTTGGRIMVHRPKLAEWSVSFDLTYDEDLLSEVQVRQIVDDSGSLVGVLDYRPEKKGPFGRFFVTEWKVV